MKPIVYFIVFVGKISRLRQRGHQVDGHDPVSPAGLLDAVAAAAGPQVGRHCVRYLELLEEAGPSGSPVIVHSVTKAGNN